MGNSNSLTHFAPNEIDLRAHRNHNHWQHVNSARASFQPQSIKVLPDVNEHSRLRSTNNGVILQSGGTISGRRESMGVHRSKSISSPQHEMRYKVGLQRHNTQLDMVIDRRLQQELDAKRFGSEPDLRFPEEGNAKKSGNSKKIKAPNIPIKLAGNNRPDYDAARFGWRPKSHQDVVHMEQQHHHQQQQQPQQTKKLRLFKTKDESKKVSSKANTSKLATEASDVHFKKPFLDRRNKYSRDSRNDNMPPRNGPSQNYSGKPQQMPPTQVQVLPTPAFRREKSFDISLLLSRSKKEEPQKSSILPNVFRKISDNKKVAAQSSSKSKPMNVAPAMIRSKTIIASPDEMKARRASQPVQMSESDFQKELLEATRRRSMLVPIKDDKVSQAPKETATNKSARTAQSSPVAKKVSASNNVVIPTAKITKPVEQQKVEIVPKTTRTQQQAEIPVQQSIKLEIKHTASAMESPTLLPASADKPKTFYFGMDEQQQTPIAKPESQSSIVDNIETEAIDLFAKSLMKLQKQKTGESSESAMSSDIEENNYGATYDDDILEGISLQLRPTLPKKQFEIPRFSPAAAWRLLSSAIEAERECNPWRDDRQDLFDNSDRNPETSSRNEEQIERIYREPIPGLPDNKSGDSGISGDGLMELTDSSPINLLGNEMQKLGPFLTPWTPQQDLGEDSSSEGGDDKIKESTKPSVVSHKHVFSLSLPRESQMSVYSEKTEKQSFNSLQKIKNTFYGSDFNQEQPPSTLRNDNWFLSRSAPNSIDKNLPLTSLSDNEEAQRENSLLMSFQQPAIQPPSFSYLAGGRHFMYLPNRTGEENNAPKQLNSNPPLLSTNIQIKAETESNKSNKRDEKRESLQDPESSGKESSSKSKKGHRFTFQSTVRQIERKRLADKLSKEAEEKEAQRLSELEAMRRVEEEFQKKRAREKASIRQQLRLYSMEESKNSNIQMDCPINSVRDEPDGATSSPNPSQTSLADNLNENFTKEYAKFTSNEFLSYSSRTTDVRQFGMRKSYHADESELERQDSFDFKMRDLEQAMRF